MKRLKIVLFALFGIGVLLASFLAVKAVTNIDSTKRYAWSDVSGWWDFYDTNTVIVGTSSLHGYASSSIGPISLNCDSSPIGDICTTSDYKVCNGDASGTLCVNTGSGELSGCAWNDAIGWISFNCENYDCTGLDNNICAQSNYKVTINSSGTFSGFAWNDIDGWISFNCADTPGLCSTSPYSLQTSWTPGVITGYLESSVFDTQTSGGVILNSIIWQGTQPANTSVDFQIAVSNSSSGPWTFKGPEGLTNEYYGAQCPSVGSQYPAAGADKPICVTKSQVANYRYLRYKVRLQSDLSQSISPEVRDVILNFSK